ncbi:HEPN domain-containing protein [Scytonema sp. PRP1]|uniref:ApeA N-terminal domain 1-containing protein n=1 Tax=Scytonema sp. PRP1 TaxID=3120513 RepID=UPI002FD639A8
MESFDFKGFWWLPNNPSEKLAGICSFTPSEGGELELIGDFSSLAEGNDSDQPLLILGTTLKGEITLYNCFLTKKEMRHGSIEVSLYCVNLIFSDIHFCTDSDVKFNSISIHYSCVNEWVNLKTFDFVHSEDSEEHLVYKAWEQLAQASVDNNYRLSIDIRCGKSVNFFEKITVDRKVFLTIESSEEKHYKEYRQVMRYIRNFLTLGITKPVFPLVMNGFISKDGQTSVVRILGKLAIPENDITESKLSWHEMFFTFRDISDNFEFFVKNWFNKVKDLGTISELYFGTLENPDSYYPQQEFLSLIQALESYCQKNLNPNIKKIEKPENEYLEMVEVIINQVQEENYKGWLKSKLKNSNHTSLSVKIMSLLKSASLQEIIKHLKKSEKAFNVFLDGKSRDDFVNKIVKIRNNLSHGSGYNEDVYGKDFRLQIQRLKVLIEILLLKELGFDKETVGTLLLRSRVGLRISENG